MRKQVYENNSGTYRITSVVAGDGRTRAEGSASVQLSLAPGI
jgi:hypothetical protein